MSRWLWSASHSSSECSLARLLYEVSGGMDNADLSAIRERITAEKTILATLGLCERCGYPLDGSAPHPEADRG